MVYKHGVYTSEVPTSIISSTTATAGLQVVVGTAPINIASSLEYVNKPFLASNFNEAKDALGYSDDWKNYTLCEVMDSSFRLFGVAPVVFINVLDPVKHSSYISDKEIQILSKKAVINEEGILLDTLEVKLTDEGDSLSDNLEPNTDYIASFDEKGHVVIAIVPTGSIPPSQTKLFVDYSKLNPSLVTNSDIIGSFDVATGATTGMELINSVFPKFGLVPGQILAPKYSTIPTIEAVMKAKASNINSFFKAIALVDVETNIANNYTKVGGWKEQFNYTAPNEIVCWPKVALGEKVYHLSTQIAGCNSLADSLNSDVPYVTPSNQSLHMNKLVLDTGQEVFIGPDQANYLNGQGVVTALNFKDGWKAWGSRTGAYPSNKDVKDSYIPVRRMHDWVGNSIILSTWNKVDSPISRRLIDSIVDTLNIWLNGLINDGALVGGRVEFRPDDNPIEDMINGTVRFRVYLAEPVPAENIEFILEFDATYYNNLF